ncbi:hypothetical protein BIFGAL_04143 [Bifidobacterium gallicum DSM 20093 = LMG 11596]|uniref:Uncharacterized protein n=1 Tax=Bifidobacterium gallicum DSM 20093 = LMG 11596 TaxID=561180 RepID=D1NW96_9BIFI|nr:hypothetical protein BIFGAL_04143 [Bifidobacterium gallicum DSM 20093 = LMG 11596]
MWSFLTRLVRKMVFLGDETASFLTRLVRKTTVCRSEVRPS